MSRQQEGAGECSKPFSEEVRTGGGGTHPGGSRAVMLTMTAALTSSPRVFPFLSFLTARRLSLIGAPQSCDLMLYFSLSRRQLRSAPCFPFGLTLILCLYV